MGSAMARNIQKAGYLMVVHDAREDATGPLLEGGAKLATSPAEVAALCDVTFTSLPGPPQVEEVVDGRDGILAGIKEGALFTWTYPPAGRTCCDAWNPSFARGAHLMDTPVLSSPARAMDRSLIVMAGGERDVFERVHPLLEAFADKVVYTGGLGTACVCKLVNNMMSFAMQQLVAEGLTLGLQAGVDLDVLMDTGSRGLLGTRKEGLSQTVFRGQFQPPSFTLALALKDVALATQLGRENNVPMRMANLAEQILRQGANRGWAEDDYTKAFLLQEEAAGTEVRS